MDDEARGRAIGLLGDFNDRMTRVVDAVYGTSWAEIEEIIALVLLASERTVTTRRIADVSGLGRRAVSRLVLRLQAEDLVVTRASATDARAVEVVLTTAGDERVLTLHRETTAFFSASADIARDISEGMGSPVPASRHASPADALDLLLRICEAGARLVRYMPAAATRGKLAARQRAALVLVAMQGGIRPSELAGPLELSAAGASHVVDQLCAKGFVARVRGTVPEDRRAVVIRATPVGFEAVGAVAFGIEQESASLAALFAELAAWRAG